MQFQRTIYRDLQAWQSKAKRKPLLLLGARQIGKTTILKSFGAKMFEHCVYLNLERQPDLHRFFAGDKDPTTILADLSLAHGSQIESGKTLLILDEIQECRDAVIAMKYFAEELSELHVIGAGSLLGLSIGNDRSFPVGKVTFMDMYPLTFSEYLQEADSKSYQVFHHYLTAEKIEPIPALFYKALQRLYKEYVLFGGMPEVAAAYLTNRDIEEAQDIQDQILRAYELDFVKHATKTTSTKIQQIWNSLPSQLAKENKKFIYKVIRSGARAREYEEAIQWLVQAGLVRKVARVEKAGVPLKAYEDITTFKLYLLETGLLIRLAGLDPSSYLDGSQFFTEFKGSIAENIVAQSLGQIYGHSPYYWTSDGKAEVDFILEQGGHCIPVEVKSGSQTKTKSLAVYTARYQPRLRVRVSDLNLKLDANLLNIPLFYSGHIAKFIAKAQLSKLC